MTQENKELLLKDLCARLPYGVKVYAENVDLNGTIGGLSLNSVFLLELHDWWDIEFIKPYLRPMSSMTEEEIKEYQAFFNYDGVEYPEEYIDWLNAHHFDYRGLIEKGLAIEVTKENNPYKE